MNVLEVSSGRTNQNRQGMMRICNWDQLWTHDKGVSKSMFFEILHGKIHGYLTNDLSSKLLYIEFLLPENSYKYYVIQKCN